MYVLKTIYIYIYVNDLLNFLCLRLKIICVFCTLSSKKISNILYWIEKRVLTEWIQILTGFRKMTVRIIPTGISTQYSFPSDFRSVVPFTDDGILFWRLIFHQYTGESKYINIHSRDTAMAGNWLDNLSLWYITSFIIIIIIFTHI